MIFHFVKWALQVWNSQTQTELTLDGPVGQVYAMAVGNDVLFAGTQVYIMKTLRFFSLFFFFGIKNA